MQNNILLPNSNVAQLSGMSQSEETRLDYHHNAPENDPHFLDSGVKKGLLKLGRKIGLVEKPRRSSVPQYGLDEKPVLETQSFGEKKRRASFWGRSNSYPDGQEPKGKQKQILGDYNSHEDQPNVPMTQQSLQKDYEDARIRRASMQG
ncbi:hypothetical protein TWF694_002121 [Orbilia ellipsospora]|uniref:Uncharacterized protein n=1 Tax=Orbilia ellipsospora TaxID=2528407 RepID=A0AAV9X5U2_9PEZI